jgi:hypothetical protein
MLATRDATEVRERALRAQSLRMVACSHEHWVSLKRGVGCRDGEASRRVRVEGGRPQSRLEWSLDVVRD